MLFVPASLSLTHKSAKTHQIAAPHTHVCTAATRHRRAAELYYSSASHFSGVLKKQMCFQMQSSGVSPHCDVWVWKREAVQPESSRAERRCLLRGPHWYEPGWSLAAPQLASGLSSSGSAKLVFYLSQMWSKLTVDLRQDVWPQSGHVGVRSRCGVGLLSLEWVTASAADPTAPRWCFPAPAGSAPRWWDAEAGGECQANSAMERQANELEGLRCWSVTVNNAEKTN